MSTKNIHAMNHWFEMLRAAAETKGRSVTTGEVAKTAGTAHSTARRWLNRLVEMDAAVCAEGVAKNGVREYRFSPVLVVS